MTPDAREDMFIDASRRVPYVDVITIVVFAARTNSLSKAVAKMDEELPMRTTKMTARSLECSGFPARRRTGAILRSDGQLTIFHETIVLVNERLYNVVYLRPEGRKDSMEALKSIESFCTQGVSHIVGLD
jgi:hypothetical protein